jgi:hypothetical protein
MAEKNDNEPFSDSTQAPSFRKDSSQKGWPASAAGLD